MCPGSFRVSRTNLQAAYNILYAFAKYPLYEDMVTEFRRPPTLSSNPEMENTMKIDGGCHCGHITYEAEADPENVIVCHCTDCQVISGTVYRTVAFIPESDFTLLSGKLKTYVKIADSGAERAQNFCPHCGSHIYATDTGDSPKVYGLRTGTARQRADLVPKVQYWCGSAHDWAMDISGLDKVQSQ